MAYPVQHFRDALTAVIASQQRSDDTPSARRQLEALGRVTYPTNLTRRELQIVEAIADGYRKSWRRGPARTSAGE